MADLLDLSLDAITEQSKAARPAKAKGNGGRGKGKGTRGKGRGGFAGRGGRGGFGGPARQPRAYQARRPAPYGGGFRRTVINDVYEEEEDFEEEEEEFYEEPPQRSLQTKAARAASGLVTGTTVQVSNLHADVTEEDMKELFTNPINGGADVPIKSCCINYDLEGKCNGSCTVVFTRKSDAVAALGEYHGIPLDGQPMQLALVGMPDLGHAPQRAPRPVRQQQVVYQPRETQHRPAGRGRGGKGKGKGKGRSSAPAEPRSSVTEEELDGGLDDYFKN